MLLYPLFSALPQEFIFCKFFFYRYKTIFKTNFNLIDKIIITASGGPFLNWSNNKIKSAKENLSFTQEQLNLKKIEFDKIQDEIANFQDSNLNIINSKYENELSRLLAEFQIVNAVYTELSKQLEESKLQVNKDTPVFSIVKEASMPVSKSSPKRTQMVLMFGLVGFIFSVLFVLIKKPLIVLFKEISS